MMRPMTKRMKIRRRTHPMADIRDFWKGREPGNVTGVNGFVATSSGCRGSGRREGSFTEDKDAREENGSRRGRPLKDGFLFVGAGCVTLGGVTIGVTCDATGAGSVGTGMEDGWRVGREGRVGMPC